MVYHTSQEQYQAPRHLTSELIKYHVDHTSVSTSSSDQDKNTVVECIWSPLKSLIILIHARL